MKAKALTEELAAFIARRSYEDLTADVKQRLKVHILDSLGCAIGALHGPPVLAIRSIINEFGGNPLCNLIAGGHSTPDYAALWHAALVRYLDYMDNFLADGETCHPSDNIGALLSISDYADTDGKDFLTAMAIAYQVQCRITEEAPIMEKGFDHTTQQGIAVAAGTAKLLKLDPEKIRNAVSLAGTELNAFAVVRAVPLSEWKGLASAYTASSAVQLAFIAREGVTGPEYMFEGRKGFMEALGKKFYIDWIHEDLDIIHRCLIKRFNAEVHSQSVLEGVLELREEHNLTGEDVSGVVIDVFRTAYNIIGGGEFGEKKEHNVTKENADHSLPYLISALLIDGQLEPAQFLPERIKRDDVQDLLRKVKIHLSARCTHGYPEKMRCHIQIRTKDGNIYEKEKEDYHGFKTRPADWNTVAAKFHKLTKSFITADQEKQIVQLVDSIEHIKIRELMKVLNGIHT